MQILDRVRVHNHHLHCPQNFITQRPDLFLKQLLGIGVVYCVSKLKLYYRDELKHVFLCVSRQFCKNHGYNEFVDGSSILWLYCSLEIHSIMESNCVHICQIKRQFLELLILSLDNHSCKNHHLVSQHESLYYGHLNLVHRELLLQILAQGPRVRLPSQGRRPSYLKLTLTRKLQN